MSARERRILAKINFQGETLDKKVVLKAAKAVVVHADTSEYAKLLLDMLGIIPPQPGNEIKKRSEAKAENRNEQDRARFKERQEQKKSTIIRDSEPGVLPEPPKPRRGMNGKWLPAMPTLEEIGEEDDSEAS